MADYQRCGFEINIEEHYPTGVYWAQISRIIRGEKFATYMKTAEFWPLYRASEAEFTKQINAKLAVRAQAELAELRATDAPGAERRLEDFRAAGILPREAVGNDG